MIFWWIILSYRFSIKIYGVRSFRPHCKLENKNRRLIGGVGLNRLFGVEPKINISEHYNDLDLFIVSINVGTNITYVYMTHKYCIFLAKMLIFADIIKSYGSGLETQHNQGDFKSALNGCDTIMPWYDLLMGY